MLSPEYGHAYLACFGNIWLFKVLPACSGQWVSIGKGSEEGLCLTRACFVSQRRLRARAKKAIEQMQLRTLKEGDKVGLTLHLPCTTAQPLHATQGVPYYWSSMQKSL